MATSAAVAGNLLRNSKSLPQTLRGQFLGRSNINVNTNNMVKDHQIVQSLFVSNQKSPAQMPIFGFSEMGSFLGSSSSSGGLSLVEKGDGHGMGGLVVETRGKHTVKDEDDEEEDVDGDFDDYEEIEDVEDFDEDDDDDDDFYGNDYEYGDDDEDNKRSRMY